VAHSVQTTFVRLCCHVEQSVWFTRSHCSVFCFRITFRHFSYHDSSTFSAL